MNIGGTYIYNNIDKITPTIYTLTSRVKNSESWNAKSNIINGHNFSLDFYFSTSVYDQVPSPSERLVFTNDSESVDQLIFITSTGASYVYFTNYFTYHNDKYFLLDINYIYMYDEVSGEEVEHNFSSTYHDNNIISYYNINNPTYNNEYDNYFNIITTDNYTRDLIDWSWNDIVFTGVINNSRLTYGNEQRSFINRSVNCGSFVKNLPLARYGYTYNNFNIQLINYERITTSYEQTTTGSNVNYAVYNRQLKYINTNNSRYLQTGSFRDAITLNDTLNFLNSSYYTFDPQVIETELVCIKANQLLTDTSLTNFTALDNLKIGSTAVLGSLIIPPIVILFFALLKRIAL